MQMKQERLQSMQKEWSTINQEGFSLVEVLLSSAIFVLLVTALIGAYLYGQEATMTAGNRGRAVMLAEEGMEATRNIRDAAFANLIDGTFGLTTASNQWSLSGASDNSDIFTRAVTVSTVDSNRKIVASDVTWQQNIQRLGASSLITYLTNWQRMGIGNWATTTLAASINFSGNNNGLKIQVSDNYAYVVRSDGTPDFAIIDISIPSSPVLVGSLSLTGVPSNIFVSGNYAYVSSEDNGGELVIIDISVPTAPSIIGSYDAAGGNNANGIYVIGTTAYLVRASGGGAPDFLIINVSNPASPTLTGSLVTGQIGYEVVVSGNYAYIATGDNAQELKVINITTPAAPSLAGFLNLSGNVDAITIAMFGNAIFLGQGSVLYTVNVSTPATPVSLGSLSVVGTLNDIGLNLGNSNTYLFVSTSDNNNEFKVVNVATLSAPVILGNNNITGSNPLLGVAYDSTLDRAFAVGQSDTQEFVVIAPN